MRTMTKIAAIVAIALALGGSSCTQQLNLDTPEKQVFAIRSAYDAGVLAPAANYAQLPPCPQPNNVCRDPQVLIQLQKADQSAKAALDAAETVVRVGDPKLDTSTFVAIAQQALNAALKIISTYGIK